MALKTATIPITDHNTGGICTNYYMVRYKADSESSWKIMNPNIFTPPVVINGLSASTNYSVEITRYCCDGNQSNPVTITVTTPA